MNVHDLGPAEHFEAGASGEPGARTFFIHVVAGDVKYWFLAEKGQVAELAERAIALLLEASILGDPEVVATVLDRLGLVDPDEFSFRVGVITLRASDARELVHLQVTSTDQEESVVFEVAPEQLQAMATHAATVVAGGRETCERCRLPMDPAGHRCPSTNGYHPH